MLYPSKLLGRALLTIAVAAQATACSMPRYVVVPSVSLAAEYDDNLFFTSGEQESDVITRVSPAIELAYRSDTLSWGARYRFEAETYASHSALDDDQARSVANVGVEYRPTSRLTLSTAADYTKTNRPLDLSLVPGGAIPGLGLGRVEAKRTSLNSAANYRLTARTTGFLNLAQTRQELTDSGDKGDTRILEAYIEQRISEVSTLSYGNTYRQYRFDTASVGSDRRLANQDSNTPWIGLSHQFNARTRVTGRAGPQVDGSSNDPFVQLSLQHLRTVGEVRLDYERDETTVLGVPGRVQIQSIYGTISRRLSSRLDLEISPGFARASQTGYSVDIYTFVVGAVYNFNESVSLTASYDLNIQEVSSDAGGFTEATRNLIQVGVRFTYPRRGRR